MKYVTQIEGRRGWTKWIRPKHRGYKQACCDCGLVHRFNFRIRNGQIEYQASRDNRATAARRRMKK